MYYIFFTANVVNIYILRKDFVNKGVKFMRNSSVYRDTQAKNS